MPGLNRDLPRIAAPSNWSAGLRTAPGDVFYVHGLLREDLDCFTHLDGATIYFDPADRTRLFNEGKKLKGHAYVKHFRLDGSVCRPSALDVVRAWLPADDVTEEFLIGEHITA